ncbi:MAG: hypothetical protein HUJ51_03195 [Eggerthellaceae bacterium]|nr:hypothetical protein [Eggerthellaceae bacterium]
MANGITSRIKVMFKGLEQPYPKRCMEGGIDMRYSIKRFAEATEIKISRNAEMEEASDNSLNYFFSEKILTLPASNEELLKLDYLLSSAAVK